MELVKFVAVGNKNSIEEYSEYIKNILKELEKLDIAKNTFLYPFEEKENAFLCKVERYSDDKKRLTLNLFFEFETYEDVKQLVVEILADDYKVDIDDDYVEKLKLSVKTTIKKDWAKIVWLYDDDASILSKDLYGRFYVTENLIRRFINEFMVKTFGTEWWDLLSDQSIKEKYNRRNVSYKTSVRNFNNVDDHLLSIDVGDLLKILTMKKRSLDPRYNAEVVKILGSATAGDGDKIIDRIKNLLTVEEDFWEKYFNKYFDDKFIESFGVFEANRNHIAHNKILDRDAYKSICESIEEMDKYIQNALKKLNKEKKSLERLRAEAQQYEELLLVAKQNDTGIIISKANGIVVALEEALYQIFGEVVEALSSRKDLSFSEMWFDPKKDTGELFTVVSKVTKAQLDFCYSMEICDYEGAESILTITCKQRPFEIVTYNSFEDATTEGFKVEISYANGSVVYDDEQGYFMPWTEDGIAQVDIETCKEEIVAFINSEN